jgi:hypothetical protein
MAEVNTEDALYSGVRNGTTYRIPVKVSPILMSADELSPGNPSSVRVEFQDFAIDVDQLQNLYPPEIADRVEFLKNNETFTLTPIGVDEPPYQHVTTNRDRVMVHTQRTTRGYQRLST